MYVRSANSYKLCCIMNFETYFTSYKKVMYYSSMRHIHICVFFGNRTQRNLHGTTGRPKSPTPFVSQDTAEKVPYIYKSRETDRRNFNVQG